MGGTMGMSTETMLSETLARINLDNMVSVTETMSGTMTQNNPDKMGLTGRSEFAKSVTPPTTGQIKQNNLDA